MALIHLVYISSTVRWPEPGELTELFRTSFLRNSERGITGLLLYRNATFLQLLEGEASSVRSLYADIERDERHTGIIKLVDEPIGQREFESWSGSFEHDDVPLDTDVPGFVDFFADPSLVLNRVSDPKSRTMRLLLNFARAV